MLGSMRYEKRIAKFIYLVPINIYENKKISFLKSVTSHQNNKKILYCFNNLPSNYEP